MADNLSVSVTADTSALRAQLALAQADLKAFGSETRKLATDIRAGGDASGVLRGQLEQIAGRFNTAKAAVSGLTAELNRGSGAHEHFSLATAGARRELVVLAHELSQGNFQNFAGSLLVLAQNTGGLGSIFAGLLSPIGLVVTALAAAAAGIGYLVYQAEASRAALEGVHDSLTLMGQGALTTVDDLEKMQASWAESFALSKSQAEGLLAAFGALPKATNEQKEALAQLAVQIAQTKSLDLAEVSGELAKAFNKGADAVVELGKQYGIEDVAAEENIKTLQESGDALGAAEAAVKALSSAVDAQVGPWQRATAALKNYISSWRGFLEISGEGLAGVPLSGPGGTPLPPKRPSASGPVVDPEILQNQRQLAAAVKKDEADRYTASQQRLRTQIADTNDTKKKIALQNELAELEKARVGDSETLRAKNEEAIRAIERSAAKGHGGGGAKPKPVKDNTQARELERLTNEERVDDLISDRRTRMIEANYRAGKISLDQEQAALVDQLEQKRAAEENYFQQKTAVAQGDDRELQRLREQDLVAYQNYLTKKQDLDIKYNEAKAAADKKAAADAQAAWDKVFQPITSSFDSAVKGWIQGTTTLKQGLERAFEGILIDPLLKNVENGLKGVLMNAFSGTDIAGSFIGKFFSGTLFSGASETATTVASGAEFAGTVTVAGTTFAGEVTAAGTAFAASVGAGAGASAAGSAAGGAASAAGGAASAASGGGGIFGWLGALLAFDKGGIVPSAAGGWAVPTLGPGGVLAQLHSKEMVLPANISQMLVNAAGRSGGGAPSAVSISTAIDARGAQLTAAQFGSLLSRHEGELGRMAASAHRNGWRPS